MQTAAILVVGDEILAAEVRDENAPFLLRALNDAGVSVVRVTTTGDDPAAIVSELRHARALADAVFVSGGIGPTHDDVTRPAVAEAVGRPLEMHPEAEQRIRAWYGDVVTEAELSMALLPRGSTLLNGAKTTTFGFTAGGVYVLPGVPFLFQDISRALAPCLGGALRHRRELTCRQREGEIAPALAALQSRASDVAIGSYPVYDDGRWFVRVVLRASDEGRLEEVERELNGLL